MNKANYVIRYRGCMVAADGITYEYYDGIVYCCGTFDEAKAELARCMQCYKDCQPFEKYQGDHYYVVASPRLMRY